MDHRPGHSPGPPGRHGPRSHVELFKSRSNKNNMEREKARITAPPSARPGLSPVAPQPKPPRGDGPDPRKRDTGTTASPRPDPLNCILHSRRVSELHVYMPFRHLLTGPTTGPAYPDHKPMKGKKRAEVKDLWTVGAGRMGEEGP